MSCARNSNIGTKLNRHVNGAGKLRARIKRLSYGQWGATSDDSDRTRAESSDVLLNLAVVLSSPRVHLVFVADRLLRFPFFNGTRMAQTLATRFDGPVHVSNYPVRRTLHKFA
jgi:hypothetical protein